MLPSGKRSCPVTWTTAAVRSEEHTSELQSHSDLVCRLLLEKNKQSCDGSAGTRKGVCDGVERAPIASRLHWPRADVEPSATGVDNGSEPAMVSHPRDVRPDW